MEWRVERGWWGRVGGRAERTRAPEPLKSEGPVRITHTSKQPAPDGDSHAAAAAAAAAAFKNFFAPFFIIISRQLLLQTLADPPAKVRDFPRLTAWLREKFHGLGTWRKSFRGAFIGARRLSSYCGLLTYRGDLWQLFIGVRFRLSRVICQVLLQEGGPTLYSMLHSLVKKRFHPKGNISRLKKA